MSFLRRPNRVNSFIIQQTPPPPPPSTPEPQQPHEQNEEIIRQIEELKQLIQQTEGREIIRETQVIREVQQDTTNSIDTDFIDELPTKLLMVDWLEDEEGCFNIKFHLHIYVYDEEKNASACKYVEIIFNGLKKKNEKTFFTQTEICYITQSIRTSGMTVDIGSVTPSVSVEEYKPCLNITVDILPGLRSNQTGRIKGYYTKIIHNEKGLLNFFS